MKYVVRKAFFNYEKEEKYLNEMAVKGLALTDYSWCRYVFQDCRKGEYFYRIELLDQQPDHPESIDYIKFMEETGAECIALYKRWVYFRRKAEDGPFDIYSDAESKIRHYKKVNRLWMSLAGLELAAGLLNVLIGAVFFLTGEGSNINLPIGIPLVILGFVFVFLAAPSRRSIKRLEKERGIWEKSMIE
jgi:hypothetical protein